MQKKSVRLFGSALLTSVFLYFLAGSFAWAGVRIDKPKIRLSTAPGSYDSGEINVENIGDEAADIHVYLEDWIYSKQDGSKEFLPKGTNRLSCSNWINFYPADFTLKPKTSQKLRYTVTVPEGVQGGHFSVMFFETGGGTIEQANEKGESVSVKVYNRLGALFYVEPQGTVKKSGEIKNIKVDQKLNDLTVELDFLNTGNTDITAKGTFNVIDQEGYVYARGEFDPVYTFPDGKAFLRGVANSVSLKSKDYDLVVTLEFENGGSLVREASFRVSSNGVITLLNTNQPQESSV